MTTLKTPSSMLLRTFLKPTTLPQCSTQIRQASNYMPRSKYAKVTRLDKLHRTQKAAVRQEKFAASRRAEAISATYAATQPTATIPILSPPPPRQDNEAVFAQPNSMLPFTIVRTPSSQLPIYESAKAGGSRHITTIRKLSGDLDSLAEQLRVVLKVPEYLVDKKGNKKPYVAINRLTNHIVVRGWRGQEVKAWMESAGF